MKQLRSVFLYALPVVLFLLQNGCSPELAGATTETTNGVTGKLHNHDNTPAAEVIVKLFTEGYDPMGEHESLSPVTDTTDKKGTFKFEDVTPGRYTVLALDYDAAAAFYADDIGILKDSMTTISDGTLEATGAVVTDFSASENITDNDYVYLPGTDLYTYIGTTGTGLLNSVPVGKYAELILATSDGTKRNVLHDTIRVTSQDTVAIINPLWPNHQDIILNTTPTGADITDDIPDFPVLIRLNKDNFDFEQALPDGGDLLFINNSNTPLAFEIEQWDAENEIAVIWVKIDTIYGNNSSQSFRMYWGNTDASPLSDGGTVFDTAIGYQGVWHLADEDNAEDATFNRFKGTSPEGARPRLSEGIIGGCRNFDGVDDYISMPNTASGKLDFEANGSYTVSAWVLLDNTTELSHCIVSKGYEQYYLRSTYISKDLTMDTPLWEFVEFNESEWSTSTSPSTENEWTHLVGVRDGNRQLLFSNGELVDSTIEPWNPVTPVSRNTVNNLFIGRFAEPVGIPFSQGYGAFKGSIDEIKIMSKPQNPEWVRLCYMNQRPDDRLVEFK